MISPTYRILLSKRHLFVDRFQNISDRTPLHFMFQYFIEQYNTFQTGYTYSNIKRRTLGALIPCNSAFLIQIWESIFTLCIKYFISDTLTHLQIKQNTRYINPSNSAYSTAFHVLIFHRTI